MCEKCEYDICCLYNVKCEMASKNFRNHTNKASVLHILQNSLFTSLTYKFWESEETFTLEFRVNHIKTMNVSVVLALLVVCLAFDSAQGSVSCGGHSASSCPACPGDHGHWYCNGDCTWRNNGCQFKGNNTLIITKEKFICLHCLGTKGFKLDFSTQL